MDTCGALNLKSPLLGSGTNAILFDPWIFSAMAMAMSIYRTLCVLVKFVFLSLQEYPKVSSFSSATGLLISGTVRAINIL